MKNTTPAPEAWDIVALHLEAQSMAGTPEHAAAVKLLERTKATWKRNLRREMAKRRAGLIA